MKSAIRFIRLWTLVLAASTFAVGCSEDETDSAQQGYGYVQFRLYKSGSYGQQDEAASAASATRAADRLEYLHEAAKIRVTLRSTNNDILSPTVNVEAADKELAEWGMQSDKFQLTSGSYTILGYEIFDAMDQSILLGEPSEETVVTIIPGGLVTQDIVVNVVERGWVKFTLTKDSSELPQTRASQDGANEHPFHDITFADVTVKNKVTNSTTEFKGLRMSHEIFREEENDDYYTSVCRTDSIVPLEAGLYEVIAFRTYFDRSKKVYETSAEVSQNEFRVNDNRTAEADVPVTLHITSGHIADAIALKEIWEGLDGPNWDSPIKWDFNRDVDLWTAQDGVQVLENGRIGTLSFEGTGAKGAMPAAIGKLTDLQLLSLGSHSFEPGSSTQPNSAALLELARTDREAYSRSFHETFIRNGDYFNNFSEEMQLALELNNVPRKKSTRPLRALPGKDDPKFYTNYITSLPDEINNLKKLSTLSIGYCPLTTLPENMSGMESLTDLEIFYCSELTQFPMGIATLPKLISMTFSCNYNVDTNSMYDGIKALNAGAAGKKLQTIYFTSQPIDVVPDMSAIETLALLNVENSGITKFEKEFGKEHAFVSFMASHNKLTSLPVDSEGYFIGLSSETEEINFSHNEFEELPDIFNARSVYQMGTIDFSYNKIERIGQFQGEYRGLYAQTLNLSGNRFKKYPAEIAKSGTAINYLQMSANGLEEIEEKAFEGEYTRTITTIDLSYNKLKSLPKDFNALTFPFLNGLDLSYNRFDAFPFEAVNNQYLSVFIFRHQRNEKGERCMSEWPTGIGDYLYHLRALYLGSNNLKKVTDNLSYLIYNLDISDNPDILIDISALCPYIKAGMFNLIYSPDQDIRGCDALILDK